jgi:hypothetical protein
MNDKEKAKEIAENSKQYFYHDEYECGLACALRMAQWKDKQFDEEKKELLGLVNMLPVDDHNQTIIEDLIALLR